MEELEQRLVLLRLELLDALRRDIALLVDVLPIRLFRLQELEPLRLLPAHENVFDKPAAVRSSASPSEYCVPPCITSTTAPCLNVSRPCSRCLAMPHGTSAMYRNWSLNGDTMYWSLRVNGPENTSKRCEPLLISTRLLRSAPCLLRRPHHLGQHLVRQLTEQTRAVAVRHAVEVVVLRNDAVQPREPHARRWRP